MHGQNEHQLLLRNNQHRILLDDYAGTGSLCQEINVIVHNFQKIKDEITNLKNNNENLTSKKEFLNHQLNELEQLDMTQEELDSIEDDFKVSQNASLLVEKISRILESLDHDSGVNNILIEGESVIGESMEYDNRLDSIQSLLSSAQVQIQESIYDLSDYLSKISSSEAVSYTHLTLPTKRIV